MDDLGCPELLAQVLVNALPHSDCFLIEANERGWNGGETEQDPKDLHDFSIRDADLVAQIHGSGLCNRPNGGVENLIRGRLHDRPATVSTECLFMHIAGNRGAGDKHNVFLDMLQALINRRQVS